MLVALFLGITASSLHSAVSVLLVQQLARQSVALHRHLLDHATLARLDDSAAEALGVRWNTAIWVISAMASVVAIPVYSSHALSWGRRRLLLLGLGSMALCEVGYAYVAARSSACSEEPLEWCRPEFLFGILAGCAVLLGTLGGDQLVILIARMITIDESTEETRAEQINYLQAVALGGYVTGPVLASLLAGRSARSSGDAEHQTPEAVIPSRLFFASMAIYLVAIFYVMMFVNDERRPGQRTDTQAHEARPDEDAPSQPTSRRIIDRYLAIVRFEPKGDIAHRTLAPLRRLPIAKILVCSLLAFDGSSVMSYMLLFADSRFDWTAREVRRC